MPESTALVCVAGGPIYEAYAEQLMESAREHFHPTARTEYIILDGEAGWPNGTLLRYHRLLRERIETDWLYMIDADMLMVSEIYAEILPPEEFAIVLTEHPGYVDMPAEELPFEDRPESACYVPLEKRRRYYCGGFWGGERLEVFDVARMMVKRIDEDISHGITPRWNDESALNCAVTHYGGYQARLSPAFCFPADPTFYEQHVWTQKYEPRIIAVDKPPEHREGRGDQ